MRVILGRGVRSTDGNLTLGSSVKVYIELTGWD